MLFGMEGVCNITFHIIFYMSLVLMTIIWWHMSASFFCMFSLLQLYQFKRLLALKLG
jgi:hypothetical protein